MNRNDTLPHKLSDCGENAFNRAQESFAKRDLGAKYLNAAGYYLTQAVELKLESRLYKVQGECNDDNNISKLLNTLTIETGYTNAELSEVVSVLVEFAQKVKQDESYFISEQVLRRAFPVVEEFLNGNKLGLTHEF